MTMTLTSTRPDYAAARKAMIDSQLRTSGVNETFVLDRMKAVPREDFVPENQWAFVPIGFNLQFEHDFFWQRCISNGLRPVDILKGPFLDLKTVAVLMNKGEFKGAALHNITGKPRSGSNIPNLYSEKKYEEIENYIKNETDEFSKFCVRLYEEMPKLLDVYKKL